MSERIYVILNQLVNRIIVIASEIEIPEQHFHFNQEFLKDFYEKIKLKLIPAKILISNIESKSYCEIYEFKKGGFVATYKFHYNGKGIFKKTEIIASRTTGLIEEINSLLN